MRESKDNRNEMNYVTDPIGGLYRRLLPSAIGSLLMATVESLVDVVILSHYLGPSMLAVVELCMPVYMLVNTLAMLISSGGCTLYAHALGEGDREEALRCFSLASAHILLCGGVLTLFGLLFTTPVVRLLGANDAVMAPTMEYAHVLFFFMIPLMLYVHLLFFVRVDNDPNRVLAATVVCAVTNFVLDILFVGPLGWGPGGAALATCLAYTLGAAVNLTHFLSESNTLSLVTDGLRGRGLRMWRAGLPLAASQLGMTISTNVFNIVIMSAGNENYVAVYAVITQLSMTTMAICDGVGQATQPIVAAASGAGLSERIRQVFRWGVALELIGTGALALGYGLCAQPIAHLFSIREGALLALALTGIRVYALSLPMKGLNCIIMYHFQAQEQALRGLAVALLSESVLPVAALLVLTALFRTGAVWYTWAAAQALALLASTVLLRNSSKR